MDSPQPSQIGSLLIAPFPRAPQPHRAFPLDPHRGAFVSQCRHSAAVAFYRGDCQQSHTFRMQSVANALYRRCNTSVSELGAPGESEEQLATLAEMRAT